MINRGYGSLPERHEPVLLSEGAEDFLRGLGFSDPRIMLLSQPQAEELVTMFCNLYLSNTVPGTQEKGQEYKQRKVELVEAYIRGESIAAIAARRYPDESDELAMRLVETELNVVGLNAITIFEQQSDGVALNTLLDRFVIDKPIAATVSRKATGKVIRQAGIEFEPEPLPDNDPAAALDIIRRGLRAKAINIYSPRVKAVNAYLTRLSQNGLGQNDAVLEAEDVFTEEAFTSSILPLVRALIDYEGKLGYSEDGRIQRDIHIIGEYARNAVQLFRMNVNNAQRVALYNHPAAIANLIDTYSDHPDVSPDKWGRIFAAHASNPVGKLEQYLKWVDILSECNPKVSRAEIRRICLRHPGRLLQGTLRVPDEILKSLYRP